MSVDQNDTQVATEFLGEEAPAKVTVEDLVGEGKPYKTNDDLAYSREMADRHINTLEAETARLREENATLKDQGSVIDELRSEIMSTKSTNQTQVEPDPASGSEEAPKVDLSEQVRQVLAQEKQQEIEQSNLNSVKSVLVTKYGESWQDNFKRIAQENGLTDADLVGVATRSPQMFFKVSGLDNPSSAPSTQLLQGGTNSEALVAKPTGGEVRDRAFYRAKRKEMGTSFYDSHWNAQEHKDAMEHPERFS